ncbi:tetratricopeptide repeat protein 12-like [Bacillus rossius redtenbacheri]|uniref:tetratricopeptide repeat protein 12-like n=1 Tax=Bacillus rossius redtenbacheri TaxID=93214 RepID=UPI002FDD7EAB
MCTKHPPCIINKESHFHDNHYNHYCCQQMLQLNKFEKPLRMDSDFEEFMLKVENIESIVRGLQSTNRDEVEVATRRAEAHLNQADCHPSTGNQTEGRTSTRDGAGDSKIRCDRTAINKWSGGPSQQDSLSPEAFMKQVEQDAQDRAADRERRKQLSDSYEARGDEAFKRQDHIKALDMYDKAIGETRHSGALHEKRARASLGLGLSLRALEDCDRALGLPGAGLGARLVRARALHNLGRAGESADAVREALERHPGEAGFIRDYVSKFSSITE